MQTWYKRLKMKMTRHYQSHLQINYMIDGFWILYVLITCVQIASGSQVSRRSMEELSLWAMTMPVIQETLDKYA